MALPPYLSNDDDLNKFRTKLCERYVSEKQCHFRDRCQYSHDQCFQRRNPTRLHYSPVLCPLLNIVKTKYGNKIDRSKCFKNRECPYAHNREEQVYHPLIYKTVLCNDFIQKGSCPRFYCPFAHASEELRPINLPHGVSPELIIGASDSVDVPSMENEIKDHPKNIFWINSKIALQENFDLNAGLILDTPGVLRTDQGYQNTSVSIVNLSTNDERHISFQERLNKLNNLNSEMHVEKVGEKSFRLYFAKSISSAISVFETLKKGQNAFSNVLNQNAFQVVFKSCSFLSEKLSTLLINPYTLLLDDRSIKIGDVLESYQIPLTPQGQFIQRKVVDVIDTYNRSSPPDVSCVWLSKNIPSSFSSRRRITAQPFHHETASETANQGLNDQLNVDLSKADVWSTGAVLYSLLSGGEHPVGGDWVNNPETVTERLRRGPETNEMNYLESCPILRDLLQKMTSKNPQNRLSAQETIDHPFFWQPEELIMFLKSSSRVVMNIYKCGQPSKLIDQLEYSVVPQCTFELENQCSSKFGNLMKVPKSTLSLLLYISELTNDYGVSAIEWLLSAHPLVVQEVVVQVYWSQRDEQSNVVQSEVILEFDDKSVTDVESPLIYDIPTESDDNFYCPETDKITESDDFYWPETAEIIENIQDSKNNNKKWELKPISEFSLFSVKEPINCQFLDTPQRMAINVAQSVLSPPGSQNTASTNTTPEKNNK
eukprot:GHVL01040100.1.p1 GENE.GHVL01040100.1~~GHVL01040100.1.p1  ORF type:complete len:712 (-),score=149.47 GHVL01040100.1:23-2158(-)